MPSKKLILSAEKVDVLIHEIRGQRVLLDSDLASVYGVETKAFNRAVRRNASRFPKDFVFQLTPREFEDLRCQIGTSRSSHGGRRHRPSAFTEHGAIMAATVLNSPRAVQMSVFVVRAFVKMRGTLLSTSELARKLGALERQLAGRLDSHESAIVDVLQKLMLILNPPQLHLPPRKPRIGFRP